MRVMCISDKWNPSADAENAPKPNIGDVDTVISEHYCALYYNTFYKLARFPNNYYGTNMFAILPDEPAEVIEEPEMMEA